MTPPVPDSTSPALIAPCGINCRLCRAYLRDKKACAGCRGSNTNKSKACITCKIKNCKKLGKGKLEYCFECDEFPCTHLVYLDKRYRTRYETSPINNLLAIQKFGINEFIQAENTKWVCSECGAMLCMHRPQCLSCGHPWRHSN